MSRKHEAFSLDDRLAAAFTEGATADIVAVLIQEAESAARAAGDAAEHVRSRTLDPAAADAATVRRERLQAVVSRLRQRLTQVQAAEEDDRRRVAYEDARAERDQLAAELARVYPPLAAQLADLLGRLRASDDRIEYINAHALPRGCGPLLVAELVARGLDGFVRDSIDIPHIVRRVQLPAFQSIFTRPTRGRDPRASTRGAWCFAPLANWVRALPERRCA